jgi:hypothetical protein
VITELDGAASAVLGVSHLGPCPEGNGSRRPVTSRTLANLYRSAWLEFVLAGG